jgi:hypothetical protein
MVTLLHTRWTEEICNLNGQFFCNNAMHVMGVGGNPQNMNISLIQNNFSAYFPRKNSIIRYNAMHVNRVGGGNP